MILSHLHIYWSGRFIQSSPRWNPQKTPPSAQYPITSMTHSGDTRYHCRFSELEWADCSLSVVPSSNSLSAYAKVLSTASGPSCHTLQTLCSRFHTRWHGQRMPVDTLGSSQCLCISSHCPSTPSPGKVKEVNVHLLLVTILTIHHSLFNSSQSGADSKNGM